MVCCKRVIARNIYQFTLLFNLNIVYCIVDSGKRKTLAYYLFIDSKCTRPIKRVEHDIYSAVPYYDQCVFSRTDERAALTVCHNSGGSGGGGGVVS